MRFDVVSIFPEIISGAFQKGIVGQSLFDSENSLNLVDLRSFSKSKHAHVDDRPFGGGDGMIFLAEPVKAAMKSIKRGGNSLSIYVSPQGAQFNHRMAQEFSELDQLVILCGRYGGVDERVISSECDREVSIGDFVLSGGEYAAIAIIDAVTRLREGVLGNQISSKVDSFTNGWLEAPAFTRPREFDGLPTPEVLLSGDHQKINQWRESVSFLRTYFRRPDLLEISPAAPEVEERAWNVFDKMPPNERKACGLPVDPPRTT